MSEENIMDFILCIYKFGKKANMLEYHILLQNKYQKSKLDKQD